MAMNRKQKEAEVKVLEQRFADNETIVVAHYDGITVEQLKVFRAQLRAEGATFKVAKNSLVKRAIKGSKFEGAVDLFSGPTGIVASEDVVAAAKVAQKFAKENENFKILGGAMGSQILDVQGVEALAKMPSLDELRGKLVGLLQAPASKIARIMQAPAQNMVGVTKAYGEKG